MSNWYFTLATTRKPPIPSTNCKHVFCTATKAELQELTKHPNGVVRCYAFKALCYDTTVALMPIVLAHISDTAIVETKSGCIHMKQQVADVFISAASARPTDLPYNTLTSYEKNIIDRILLSLPYDLWAKYRAIERAKENKTNYELLRKLYLIDRNDQAMIALASFHKEEDIPLILDYRTEEFIFYQAIEEFPHSTFFAILSQRALDSTPPIARQYEYSSLFKAITSYKNDAAVALLNTVYNKKYPTKTEQLIVYGIFYAIQEHYTPIYNNLLWKLWEKHNKVNRNTFNLLYHQNPTKALALAQKTIMAADSIEDEYSYDGDSIINTLLDTVKAHDKQTYIQLVQKNIITSKDHLFNVFASRASEMRDSTTAEAFFARLENEVVTFVYLEAAYQLILYNDKKINQRLIDFNKRHSAIYKKNNQEDLTQLLKNYNIL